MQPDEDDNDNQATSNNSDALSTRRQQSTGVTEEDSNDPDETTTSSQQKPDAITSSTVNASTKKKTVYVWSWKETSFQMVHHPPGSIVGDPSDCWIRYGRHTHKKLETAHEQGDDTCDLDQRYEVNLNTMMQINKLTGFQRKVQRTVDKPKVWCWKEIQGLMWKHSPSTIYGNPSDCWILYSQAVSDRLERFYLEGDLEEVSVVNGLVVNFDEMLETNEATGFDREVQRVDVKEEEEQEEEGDKQVVPDSASSGVAAPPAVAAAPIQKVWCWKETDGFQWNHDPSKIHGDPANCWIKYDEEASGILEDAFQTQPYGIVSPRAGYNVNLAVMKQVNVATGFERDVQRVDPIEEEEDDEEEAFTLAQAQEKIANLQNDSEKLEDKQDEMEKELKTIRTELQETQSELKKTTQERDELKTKVDSMKETLDALKKSVDLLLQGQATNDLDPSSSGAKKRLHADLLEATEDQESSEKRRSKWP